MLNIKNALLIGLLFAFLNLIPYLPARYRSLGIFILLLLFNLAFGTASK